MILDNFKFFVGRSAEVPDRYPPHQLERKIEGLLWGLVVDVLGMFIQMYII